MSKYFKIIIFLAAAIFVFYLTSQAIQYYPLMVNRPLVDTAAADRALKSADKYNLYSTIEMGFPDEYQRHLIDLVSLSNEKGLSVEQRKSEAFKVGYEFSSELRRNNAKHLVNAPLDMLRNIQEPNSFT